MWIVWSLTLLVSFSFVLSMVEKPPAVFRSRLQKWQAARRLRSGSGVFAPLD